MGVDIIQQNEEELSIVDFITSLRLHGAVIYGAGYRGEYCLHSLKDLNINVCAIADREAGKSIGEYLSVSVDTMCSYGEVEVCIVTPRADLGDLKERLEKHFRFVVDMGVLEFIRRIDNKSDSFYKMFGIASSGFANEEILTGSLNGALLECVDRKNNKKAEEILSNWKEIRPHYLWSERIGEFLSRIMPAIMDSRENRKRGILDVYILNEYEKTNQALLAIMKRAIVMIDEENIEFWLSFIQSHKNIVNMDEWDKYYDRRGVGDNLDIDYVSSQLSLSAEEDKKCAAIMADMELTSPYVCIHNRDTAFLSKTQSGINYSYHDFRNSSIQNFSLAAKELAKNNVTCVRMGYMRNEVVKFDNCIDYASSYHDDVMDLYLPEHCLFYVGVSDGLLCVPLMRGTPVAVVNFVYMFSEGWANMPQPVCGLYIPKKYYSRKYERLLTLEEICAADIDSGSIGWRYEENEIEFIENTEEEIRDLVLEMYQRVTGTWTERQDDDVLQKKYQTTFRNLCSKNGIDYKLDIHAKIGTKYLRDNQYLLHNM